MTFTIAVNKGAQLMESLYIASVPFLQAVMMQSSSKPSHDSGCSSISFDYARLRLAQADTKRGLQTKTGGSIATCDRGGAGCRISSLSSPSSCKDRKFIGIMTVAMLERSAPVGAKEEMLGRTEA